MLVHTEVRGLLLRRILDIERPKKAPFGGVGETGEPLQGDCVGIKGSEGEAQVAWLCTCLFTATILPTYHVFLAANKFHLASTGSVIAYTMFAKEIILFLSLRVKHGKFDSSLPILSGLDKAILLIVFLWLVVNYACFGLQEDIAKTTNGIPPQSIRSILYFSPAFILAFNSYLLLNN